MLISRMTSKAKRPSFHVPLEAGPHIVAIQRRTCLDDPPSIIRMAIVAFCDMIELEAVGYRLAVRAPSGEERFFSPYARAVIIPDEGSPVGNGGYQKLPRCFFPSAEVAGKIAWIGAKCNFGAHSEAIRAAAASFDRASEFVIHGHQFLVRAAGGFERPYSPFGQLQRNEFPLLLSLKTSGYAADKPLEMRENGSSPAPAL
jgi:hypothetical protein